MNCGGCFGTATPNMCSPEGCCAITCMQQGYNCGLAGDGCGGVLMCGTCPPGQTCGGGGKPNACG
jgi:hypothetical protein